VKEAAGQMQLSFPTSADASLLHHRHHIANFKAEGNSQTFEMFIPAKDCIIC